MPNRIADTAAPARNFSLAIEDRIRALASGPPAYIRRRRAIEDTREELLRALVLVLETAPSDGVVPEDEALRPACRDRLQRLNTLVEKHNRYYPIEANLPLDPRTGALLERGSPWKPLALFTLEELVGEARALRLVNDREPVTVPKR